MQATIIHNPNSGGADGLAPEEIAEALTRSGYRPVYEATSSEEDLDRVLKDIKGLVVVAGGDGSVRAVATRLIGKHIPIAILPCGTANNIARTLNLIAPPRELLAGLQDPIRCPFDIGLARSPWGVDYFLEAMGFGLFADLLAAYVPEKGKSILRSIAAAFETLPGYQTHSCRVKVDGREISNDYLLLEVLNTTSFGPRIKIAPYADPSDGQFDIVGIRRDNQDSFLTYIRSLLAGDLESLPSVEVMRGRKVEIEMLEGFTIHLDAELRPQANAKQADESPAKGARPPYPGTTNGKVEVRVLRRALQFWLPRVAEGKSPNGITDTTSEKEMHG